MTDYALATIREWNLARFAERRASMSGAWHLFADPKDLTAERIKAISPRYLFFPHWSWKVPEEIFSQSETILFHMTDLPYGRGGSPLQNLIVRGHKETMISAVRMEKGLDTGPVYMKHPLDLSGSAYEIFQRASHVIFDMIAKIVENEPSPTPQQGKSTLFKRRTLEMSALPETSSHETMYNHIRMLDAPGYPNAYVDCDDYRISFAKAQYEEGKLTAQAHFSSRSDDDK